MLDRVYSTFLPSNTTTTIEYNQNIAQYIDLPPSEWAGKSLLPRDSPFRQGITLFFLTWYTTISLHQLHTNYTGCSAPSRTSQPQPSHTSSSSTKELQPTPSSSPAKSPSRSSPPSSQSPKWPYLQFPSSSSNSTATHGSTPPRPRSLHTHTSNCLYSSHSPTSPSTGSIATSTTQPCTSGYTSHTIGGLSRRRMRVLRFTRWMDGRSQFHTISSHSYSHSRRGFT